MTVELPKRGGTLFREWLNNRHMPQSWAAWRMGYSEKHMSNVITGKARLTPEFAFALEQLTGILGEEFLYQEARHEMVKLRWGIK